MCVGFVSPMFVCFYSLAITFETRSFRVDGNVRLQWVPVAIFLWYRHWSSVNSSVAPCLLTTCLQSLTFTCWQFYIRSIKKQNKFKQKKKQFSHPDPFTVFVYGILSGTTFKLSLHCVHWILQSWFFFSNMSAQNCTCFSHLDSFFLFDIAFTIHQRRWRN